MRSAPAATAQLGAPRRVVQPDAGHGRHRDAVRAPSRGHRRHVELVLALPQSYRPGHDGDGALCAMGRGIAAARLDGLIVTGAPLEHLPFEDVRYWRELACICDWAARERRRHALHMLGGFRCALQIPRRANARAAAQDLGRLPAAGHGRKGPVDGWAGSSISLPVSRHAEVETHDVPWWRGLTCWRNRQKAGSASLPTPCNAHYMLTTSSTTPTR